MGKEIMENTLVRVDGHKGVWLVLERADDKVGTNWWCVKAIRGTSRPDYTRGQRAFPESRLTPIHKKT